MKSVVGSLFKQYEPWAKKGLLLMIVAIGVWQLTTWLGKSSTMPIKHVRIGGELNHVTREEISTSLLQLVETGYFAMNTDEIIKKVTAIEWVNKARVRRVWPDTIVLILEEQQPVAVWNETALLNLHGEVFKPIFNKGLMALPSLSGIDSKSQKVLAELRKVNQSIKSIGVEVSVLNLAEHGSWSAMMSNGIKISVGHQSPEKEISKSLKLLASLEGSLIEHLDEIDLRYPNGVSVSWKDGYKFGESAAQIATLIWKKDQPTKG